MAKRGRPRGKTQKTIEAEIVKAQQREAEKLKKALNRMAKDVANNAVQRMGPLMADLITDQYTQAIDQFYKDYEPQIYNRTSSLRQYSYRRHIQTIKGMGGMVRVGVVISGAEYPYNPYHENPDIVVNSAYLGYHGPIHMNIRGVNNYTPKRELTLNMNYFLKNKATRMDHPTLGRVSFQEIIDLCIARAIKYSASRQHYYWK